MYTFPWSFSSFMNLHDILYTHFSNRECQPHFSFGRSRWHFLFDNCIQIIIIILQVFPLQDLLGPACPCTTQVVLYLVCLIKNLYYSMHSFFKQKTWLHFSYGKCRQRFCLKTGAYFHNYFSHFSPHILFLPANYCITKSLSIYGLV